MPLDIKPITVRLDAAQPAGSGSSPCSTLADEMSLAVMAPRAAFFHAGARATQARRSSERPIAVLYDASEAGLNAMLIAAAFARSRAAPLIIILCERETSDTNALRQQVERTSARDVPGLRYVSLAQPSAGRMAVAARATDARLLIVAMNAAPAALAEMLARIECPLVTVKYERLKP